MNPVPRNELEQRRMFLGQLGIGSMALQSLLQPAQAWGRSAGDIRQDETSRGLVGLPHFKPRAKRVVCLFQSGGLSHVDLFDDKPTLHQHAGQDLPPSVRGDQRLTGMTSGQATYPVVPAIGGGRKCGAGGRWISDLLPNLQTVADELCVVKSVHSEAINHDPAITYFNTGNQQPGYASMGAWISYGLGSENANLPTFISMVSQGTGKNPGQPVFFTVVGEWLFAFFASRRWLATGCQPGSLPEQSSGGQSSPTAATPGRHARIESRLCECFGRSGNFGSD